MKKSFLFIMLMFVLTLAVSSVCSAEDEKPAFFTDEVLALIDENQLMVESLGYSQLVIPAELTGYDKSLIPENPMFVVDTLRAAGFTAYIIGGCVRDMILGASYNDIDVVSNASYEQMEEIFGEEFHGHISGGRMFGGVQHNDEYIDLATYQEVPEAYLGDPMLPEDINPSLFTDAIERDLTFNALYFEPYSGEVIDFFGGLHDLYNGIVDTIYVPEVEFIANPTTLIRSLRFAGRFDFELSERVSDAIRTVGKENVSLLLPADVKTNLSKCLDAGYADKVYSLLKEYDLMESFFPGIALCSDKEAYYEYLDEFMPVLDTTDHSNLSSDEFDAYIFAGILFPRVQELCETMEPEDAIATACAEQGQVMKMTDLQELICSNLETMLLFVPETVPVA